MKKSMRLIGLVALIISLSYFPGVAEQAFSEEQIIDDGDPETSSTDEWASSGGPDYYGTGSLWSNETGATYSYESTLSDSLEVSVWWTEWPSRCTDVSIEIYDGATQVDTKVVNQQSDGGQWNVQGTYAFSGIPKVVINSQGGCSTCADAVKFVETGAPSYQCSDGVDNDGDGLIDYPDDPGCTGPTDNDEYNPPFYQCSDGVDNDGDGLTDFPDDPGCTGPTDNDEYNPPSTSGQMCTPIWNQTLPASERFVLVMNDEAVLDKETGLVWQQSPTFGDDWGTAAVYCLDSNVGGRMGWHLPTVEQLLSLVDPTQSPLALPSGHPFNVVPGETGTGFWSSYGYKDPGDPDRAWLVEFYAPFGPGNTDTGTSYGAWCVRGGRTSEVPFIDFLKGY